MCSFLFEYVPQPSPTPERILDTIVYVNGASGVIIHSDSKNFLVLTTYHSVSKLINYEGKLISDDRPVFIEFKYVIEKDNIANTVPLSYKVNESYVDVESDLALLVVNNGIYFNYAKILNREVDIAEEIYIASNPNSSNYRTITKGIISNKNRNILGKVMIQASGGLIFGSSGGGLFTKDGKLIGTARSVDVYDTDFCQQKTVQQGDVRVKYIKCLSSAIPYIGYFIPTKRIKQFLLSTKFKNNFEYLKQ